VGFGLARQSAGGSCAARHTTRSVALCEGARLPAATPYTTAGDVPWAHRRSLLFRSLLFGSLLFAAA
jgi:hypothetical protein